MNCGVYLPHHRKVEKRGNVLRSLFSLNTHQVIEEKIKELLEEKFREPEFADCFTVEVVLRAGNRLEVFFDSDSGVTFEKCKRISRYLEAQLDEQAWLGEKYVLEVSSPGIGRPLAFRRQYPRNIGRKVHVTLQDETVRKGILLDVQEDSITLEEQITEGNKKKKTITETVIPFNHIKSTVVKVTF